MSTISSSISLVKFSATAFDQGDEGSCTANAICQAIRLQTREYHQDVGELARNQIYYDYRESTGTVTQDPGAGLISLLQTAKLTGIAHQSVALPYTGTNTPGSPMYIKPSASVAADAATQKVMSFTNMDNHLRYVDGDPQKGNEYSMVQKQIHMKDAISEQLMHGKAVMISINGYPNWFFAEQGPLASQTDRTDTGNHVGAHALVIVGKDDNLHGGSYIVENSWGSAWGDNGFGVVPYNYFDAGFVINGIAVVEGFKGVDLTWTLERHNVAEMYSVLLDRAAERSGLEYWASNLKNGLSMTQLANNLYGSAEATAKFGAMSDASFVNEIYLNSVGHAADSAGQAYWANLITNHSISRGEFAYTLMNIVETTTGAAGNPTMAEHDFLMNRATVSENFGLTYQIDNNQSIAALALDPVTSNANSVQTALVGIQSMMGWS